MHERRLAEVEKRNMATLMIPSAEASAWIRETRGNVQDLVNEVRRLNARLKDVRAVVMEPAQYGDDVPAQRVLEAVDGHRAATLDEFKAKVFGGVTDSVLCKWINLGKARVTADGKFIIDDLTGLSMEVLQGQYGAPSL